MLLRTSEIISAEKSILFALLLSLPLVERTKQVLLFKWNSRFEASITQSVLAIVLCVIGYLLVCPRFELDRLKDFCLEKSEYQELRAREALTPWCTAFGKFWVNSGDTARTSQGNWKTGDILNVPSISPKFTQNLLKAVNYRVSGQGAREKG